MICGDGCLPTSEKLTSATLGSCGLSTIPHFSTKIPVIILMSDDRSFLDTAIFFFGFFQHQQYFKHQDALV